MSDKTIIRTTCPRDCYDACGIAVVKRADGLVKVLGDPDHSVSRGALCGKCAIAYNGAWLDPTARVTRPLKRVGPKGNGQFEAISWNQATPEIAARFKQIVSTHGADTIWHAHYTGTCSLLAGGFPQRFLNRLGASEVDPDSICNAAGHAALKYMYGASDIGFDPRTARDANCILVWGANPSASAPHQHKHWLKETKAKTIVVDPVRHPTATAADLHLQIFPGSDAVLAFAMLHVLRREDLIDGAFLAAHTVGWDELQPVLDRCTPDWAAPITGLSVTQIAEAARLYGNGPSLLWLGQGLQRQPTGGNVFRAVGLLPAATGNFAKPGAGFLYLNGGSRRGIDGDYLEAPRLRRGGKHTISHMDLVATLSDPTKAQSLITWNINIAASNPDQARLQRVLSDERLFHIAIDPFPTDTTDFADYVLPAASFLEFDDLVSPYFHLSMSAQVKALEPMGDALPNQEIFRRLAKAMEYSEPELFEDDRTALDTLCRQVGLEGFAGLAAKGTVDIWQEPVPQFANLRFPTPSGKIEIASAVAEADGHPRLPQPLADPRPQDGRLRLLSPASAWLMNSTYNCDPKIADKLGPESIALNPTDAARLGLLDGDAITATNETGRLELRAGIADIVPAGVALSHKSRWPKLSAQRANVNALNPGRKTDMAESSAVHSVEVTIRKA
ncbi:molybdopterin-containing oxidoreductase family protein [Dongia deserti]|uniref:molybdopterin-containing oxidoreductase family protein n=1 Tax=Dongia deserti TaxID=2268030 RepID=UPI000E646A02|nr:molybdopterin-dependent oxidoreductase [Dongia deserti]